MKYLKKYKLFENVNEQEIHYLCKKYGIENYTINTDGSIDVDGNVDLENKGLTKLPLRFKNVSGDFSCSYNQLTNLEGAPSEVGGSFQCYNNNLTSLEGAPSEVGGDFYCEDNNLTSLEWAPTSVGGDFYCEDNNLTSLDGLEFKSFREIDLKDNPIYPIVKDWINRDDREELIEYFVDMRVIQGNKLIKERLFAFYDEVDILGLNDLKDYKVV